MNDADARAKWNAAPPSYRPDEVPPYPFPSGYVPRVQQLRADMEWALLNPPLVSGNTAPKPKHDAAIQQAVDDYLLMERKARAWDKLVTELKAEVLKHHDRDAQMMLERMGVEVPEIYCRSCGLSTKGGEAYCDEGCKAEHARALRAAADLR
jgi:hypothetical protein